MHVNSASFTWILSKALKYKQRKNRTRQIHPKVQPTETLQSLKEQDISAKQLKSYNKTNVGTKQISGQNRFGKRGGGEKGGGGGGEHDWKRDRCWLLPLTLAHHWQWRSSGRGSVWSTGHWLCPRTWRRGSAHSSAGRSAPQGACEGCVPSWTCAVWSYGDTCTSQSPPETGSSEVRRQW